MRIDRRRLLACGFATGATQLVAARPPAVQTGPSGADLDRAAAAPVLTVAGITSPVVIDSIRLLRKDGEYFVHVRSKDGAEGVSLPNPPRADYLDKILRQLVIPFFIGKDARQLEPLLWDLYRQGDNYKLYGLALWSPQAWVEFAILDMLGRIAGTDGALPGPVVRKDVAVYVASGRRKFRGAVRVRSPRGDQGSRRRTDDSRGRWRAGIQRMAVPLDDPEPRRGHRAARPPLIERRDPCDAA